MKDIKGYEGLYSVNKDGKVWSHKNKKFLAPRLHSGGYLRVQLHKNKTKKDYYIHRLVSSAYILNHENKTAVNHIDGNKRNNSVNNLEWCTFSENQLHSHKVGLNKGSKGTIVKNRTCLNIYQVKIIKRILSFGMLSQREIGIFFNVSQATINLINTGKNWRYC